MASTLVALQTVTVGAGGSASISFTSIPQTYTDLVVKVSARATSATDFRYVRIRFNSDSGSNYTNKRVYGDGATASSAGETNDTSGYAVTSAANNTANTFGNTDIYIPNYTSSNYKSFSVDAVSENNATTAYTMLLANIWNSTSAITSITLLPTSGDFAQYSTFTLYGVYKDAAETTPAAPTIGTATAGSQAANVAFTPAGSGAPASSYIVTSSPGGLTATGGSSPIQIGGLTSGTAYTFTVAGQNPGGVGAASAASNSVTPYDGYESISTVIVGSGGSSTVSFTSIPGTYTHLQLRAIARSGTTGESGMITFNSDTGANYSRHYLIGTGTATASGAGTSANNIDILYINSSSSTANVFATNVLDILDYANTNKYKTVKLLAGADQNGSGAIGLYSGSWRSTSAITSITITPSSSIAQYSTFELFGIRG